MIVSLTGFMGSGKSTVGRELASLLDCEFADLDRYIEHKKGMKISEIFASYGEEAFRAIEIEALRDQLIMHKLTGTDLVLALGGGTLLTPVARELVLGQSICVWLRCSEKFLLRRLSRSHGRPLADEASEEELLARLAQRTPVYALAPIAVDAEGSPYETAEEIRQRLITMEEPDYGRC